MEVNNMSKKDPRARVLDDSPFIRKTNLNNENSPTDSQKIAFAPFIQTLWGMSENQPPKHHSGNLWHFSETEKRHLLLATGAFTLALGFMSIGGMIPLLRGNQILILIHLFISMPIMIIAIGPAFVLHEIGHKISAKYYGCWAEFRADPNGLRFGVLIAMLIGIVFMAPGAVMVAGMVTRKQNGHIAAAGPLVNFGLFLIGIPLGGIILGLCGLAGDPETGYLSVEAGALYWKQMVYDIVYYWVTANLILGAFNMMPFGPLDGRKIKSWSEQAFWGMLAMFVIPLYLMFTGQWTPMSVISQISSFII